MNLSPIQGVNGPPYSLGEQKHLPNRFVPLVPQLHPKDPWDWYISLHLPYKINDSCQVNIPFVPWIPSWPILTSKCRRAMALAAKPWSWCPEVPLPKNISKPLLFFGRVQWFLGWFRIFLGKEGIPNYPHDHNDEKDKSWGSHEIFTRI